MSSIASDRPHAVCIPYPAQGHISPMLKLAKLLHLHGFHITFLNTEYNHNRLIKSGVSSSIETLQDFQFETIPDGLRLPPSDQEGTQDIRSLCESITNNFPALFRALLHRLNDPSSLLPPVSCIVSDGSMSFTLKVAEELGIPEVLLWTTSACGFMAYLHFQQLIDRGLVPLKDESVLTDGYLDTPIEWIPGMQNMRLRDLPSFIRTTYPDEIILNYVLRELQRASRALAIILNTFDDLERPVLDAMATMLPPIYTLGPLSLLARQIPESPLASLGSSLWKEETGCVQWLQGKEPESVVYANFGSTTVMSNEQLIEFAWGLANSGYDFLWVIRPDLVRGDSAVLPSEFVMEISGRGLLASWCPQEEMLLNPAIGGFLTHSGWNSTIESICGGVPMLCWPFFAEQHTNCRYACTEWGVGMEIDGDVKRKKVEGLVRDLMGGEKGKEMRRRALEWKESAIKATQPGGTSSVKLERLVKEVLLEEKKSSPSLDKPVQRHLGSSKKKIM